LEIARFVEHIVGRQEHLALLESDASPGQQRRLVGDGLPRRAVGSPREAHDGRNGKPVGQVLQAAQVALDERRTLQEILREVSAHAKFGEYREVGATLPRLLRKIQDSRGVSGEIADRGIELRQRNLHASSLGYEARSGIANEGLPR